MNEELNYMINQMEGLTLKLQVQNKKLTTIETKIEAVLASLGNMKPQPLEDQDNRESVLDTIIQSIKDSGSYRLTSTK